MKRDMDLFRRLLLQLEAVPPNGTVNETALVGEYDRATINEHWLLLKEADLIEAQLLQDLSGIIAVHVTRLTNEGHDFLQHAAEESRWQKAKQIALAKTGVVSLTMLTEILKRLVLGALP